MLTVSHKLATTALSQQAEDEVALPFDLRQKSRLRVSLKSGREAAITMPRGSILRGGEVLQSSCGVMIKVIAADEPVMQVTADTAIGLNRAAYHLGNRHVPLEIAEFSLKLEQDSVLKDMLLGLGVKVTELQASFEPESGAYGGGHRHADEESHSHSHAHPHSHAH